MDTCVISNALLIQLQQCSDLPTPPAVASKIIELSNKQDTTLETLANIVSMDPALTAKILSIANSSMYMRRIEADSIEQAVAMFGWDGTLNIALGFAVVGSIRGALTSGLDYDYFWLRSLAAATAARALGQMTSCDNVEVLFLPGLLQDIGMLALDKSDKHLYDNMGDRQKDHSCVCTTERESVRVDHAIVGQWLLSDWGVSDQVSELVGLSHCNSYHDENECQMTNQKCIYLSGHVADCLFAAEDGQVIETGARLCQQELNISMSDFIALLGHVAAQFQEMASIFDLKINNTRQIQSIKELASIVLLNDH